MRGGYPIVLRLVKPRTSTPSTNVFYCIEHSFLKRPTTTTDETNTKTFIDRMNTILFSGKPC